MATESKEAAFICRLEEHGNRLLNNLYFQRNDGKYCDLIIHTPNSSLLVHACVLSSFSSRIASLISRQISRNKIGTLNFYTVEVKFSHDVMESIVTALYTGILQPPANIVKDILLAARWLKIAEIVNEIRKHSQLEPKQKNKPLVIKTASKDKACPDVPRDEVTPDTSREGASHVSHNSEDTEEGGSVYSVDTSSESGSDTDTLNPESSQKQNCDTATSDTGKISDVNKLNHELVDANIRIHFNTSGVFPDNPVQMVDVKQEVEELSENDEHLNHSNRQVSVDSSKSSEEVKHKLCQISSAALPKRRRKISKVAATKDKGNPRKRKSADVKSKKGKRGRPAGGRVKAGGSISANLGSTVIEELNINDPVKDELDLIVGDMTYIKCTHCHVKFDNLDRYQSHIQNHPTLQCDQCNQTFFSKFALTKHFYSAHIGTEHLICRHCNYKAKTQIELRKHCTESHNDRKPFACSREGCMFTARKHHEVLQHLVVHREEREFICDKCSMSFIRQSALKHHQRACYRLEEFLCDLCGQSFNHIQSMRKHRQVIHFGIKPYKCSICSSSFGDHRNLHRHMRIHDNTFPYACPICKQQFRHSNSLKAHLASRHKDYPEDVQISLIKSMMNTQGGSSYKRSKTDPSDTESSSGKQEGGRKRKEKSNQVPDNMSALPLTLDTGAFPGERYSSFSRSDLDMVVNGKYQGEFSGKDADYGDRKQVVEEYSHDHAVSDPTEAVGSGPSWHLPEMFPVGKMEKIRSHHQSAPLVSPPVEHMIITPSVQHSAEQIVATPPLVEQAPRLMLSPPDSKVMTDSHQHAQSITSVAGFHFSEHNLLTPQSSMHKLQQASQQALERYLLQQRCSIESPK
ncbi:unnamed protein product [Candidula unifasciata]|uniref:Uncharacterized protein n=1 Tax=Candidula unifasciata TaxID=100452 RepID=A0A8S3ZUQ4_9EUPU|nr:unnamed protein product [Candidula unifasciata]